MSTLAVPERIVREGFRDKILGFRLESRTRTSLEGSRSWHSEGVGYGAVHENGLEEVASESESEVEKKVVLITACGREVELSVEEVVAEGLRIIASDAATQASLIWGYDHPYLAANPWWQIEVPRIQLADFKRKLMKMLGIEPLV